MSRDFNLTHQKLLSVIVPIYNCEDYIEECVRSLFEQTMINLEYIFIDDASTDNSLKILKELISEYPNRQSSIKIIQHTENKGISYTRMEGIRQSEGEMVIHCDADDILEKDAYETMMRSVVETNADIVGCGYRIFGDVPSPIKLDLRAGYIDALELLGMIAGSRSEKMLGSLWNKMIKKDLWDDVVIPPGLSYCEDVLALFQIFSKKPVVFYTGKILYNYRIRKNSLVNIKDNKMNEQCEILIPILQNFRLENSEDFESAIHAKIIGLLYRLLKSGNVKTDYICQKYKTFDKFIIINKQLNLLEKLHLHFSLRGYDPCAHWLGKINDYGYKTIKSIKEIKAKIKYFFMVKS